MTAALRGARAAVVFLTKIPVGGFPYRADELTWAPGWFPLVGAAIGLGLGAVAVGARSLGTFVAATLAYAAGLFLTGAFHEDGLADTADALGGTTSRERIFEILKDSRIGSYGGVALIVSLLLRIGLLARLMDGPWFALVWSQAAARLGPVWLLAALPYVTPGHTSKSRSVTQASWRQGLLATVLTIVVGTALVATGLGSAAELAVSGGGAAVVTVTVGFRFHRRAGGVTGDFLGATEQLAEGAILLGLASLRPPLA